MSLLLCREKREKIDNSISSIQEAIWKKRISEQGVEKLVRYDIEQAWQDYSFILLGVLYRWDKCFYYLNRIISILCEIDAEKNEGCIFGSLEESNYLSYEFENLLVSFSRLNEEPLIIEISRCISSPNAKKLQDNCFDKNNENGLYWELNLLRNRAAHSTPGYYTIHEDEAARYMSISSQVRNIEFKDGDYIFNTSLLSLRYNEHIKKVIRDVIINKIYGEEESKKPLMKLLFQSEKPKGKGKNNHKMLFMSNVKFFNLNGEFLELSVDILEYILNQLDVFVDEMKRN